MRFLSTLLLVLILLRIGTPVEAQSGSPVNPAGIQGFSLVQAQAYALEHNYDLRNSASDVEIARKMVKQNTAIGLPQVTAGLDYTDYLQRPTTLIPGEFFNMPGTYRSVSFVTPYNATLKGTVSQLIYSGQYLVGLQTAKAFLETSRQKNIRDNVEVRDQVADSYIRLLVIDENIKILDSTLQVVTRLVEEVRQVYQAGLLEDIDVDQAELNRSNLQAAMTYTRNLRHMAYSSLKLLLGMKDDQEMTLTDNLDFFLSQVNRDKMVSQPFDYTSNLDYILLKKSDYLTLMQYKLAKTAYQPSLSGFLSGSTMAQRTSWDFFNGQKVWYPTVVFGISLQIPVWSSGSRKYAVDQARINVEKSKVTDEKMRSGLSLQVESARIEFSNAWAIFQNKGQGYRTARKIYEKSLQKFKLGMVSSSDLDQRYNQFLASNSDYMQSIYTLLSQKIRLSRLLEKF